LRERLDAHRDALLQRAGYRILRIPAALVARNLEAAVALVRCALRA
jgi:very-short-patch-repair endonuclease